MGKKVFEVARELGVDHRVLLEKCDTLRIEARNYMSVLTVTDEGKLRELFDGDRQSSVEERVQAPGVRRRRRRVTSTDSAGDVLIAHLFPLIPLKSKSGSKKKKPRKRN